MPMLLDTQAIVTRLLARDLPPLEPGTKVYSPELTASISSLKEHRYVVAALHLANDDIHHCHLIAQAHEGDPTADLLHATLHRREGDYWNSKYWYAHLRRHPLCPSVTSARAFVDACERVQSSPSPRGGLEEMALRERQWVEMKDIVQWTRDNCNAPAAAAA